MARPEPLAELVAALQRLPGIGARSAQRLAYHLLKTPREEVDALCAAIVSVKDRVTYCSACSNITDIDPCVYCTAPERDGRIICVVEQPENVAAVEKTRGFRGRYHVLMGAIAPLQGIGPDELKIKGLLDAHRGRWRRRGHPRDQSDRGRRGHGALPRAPAEAARRPPVTHRHGRARRQRPRLHGRVHDVEGDGRPQGHVDGRQPTADEPRATADGQRATVRTGHGRQPTAYGRRPTVDSPRATADDLRPTIYGRRATGTGDGRRRTGDGKRSTAYDRHGLQRTVVGRRATADGPRQTGNGRQPTAYGRQSTGHGGRSTADDRRPTGYGDGRRETDYRLRRTVHGLR